jgi:hypothetical protein
MIQSANAALDDHKAELAPRVLRKRSNAGRIDCHQCGMLSMKRILTFLIARVGNASPTPLPIAILLERN